jgi:drug/metabolite transporter (DMT)-like permease
MGVAAVWGSTFVVMPYAVAHYPKLAFLAVRFAIASIALAATGPRVFKHIDKANLKLGLIAGVVLTLGYILQTARQLPADQGGTTPARSAFLTGMYVVLVPLISSLLHRKLPNRGIVIGVTLALAGLGALSGISFTGPILTHWVRGDTLVLLGAVAYSCHMLILGTANDRHDTRALALIQMVFLSLATGATSLVVGEHAGIPQGWQVWAVLLVTSLLASTLAYTVQTWAQLRLPPSRVALTLVLEPAFGGLFGWAVAGHVVLREAIGAALMLGGMVTSEAISARAADDAGADLDPAPEGIPIYTDNDGQAEEEE